MVRGINISFLIIDKVRWFHTIYLLVITFKNIKRQGHLKMTLTLQMRSSFKKDGLEILQLRKNFPGWVGAGVGE